MVLPLLALLAIALVLLGKSLYVYLQVTHAANEAARVATVDQPTTNFVTFLQTQYGLPSGSSVAICYPTNPATGTTRQIGDPVEVDVYTSSSWVPYASSTQIKARATMRLEQSTASNAALDPTTTYNTTTHECST
jgi:hypothetical protein